MLRCRCIDRAIQAHGAMGISQDTFLAHAWAHARTLRLADGRTKSISKRLLKLRD